MSKYRIRRGEETEAAKLKVLMQNEGYSVFQWSDQPGTIYSHHKHDRDQSHRVISGALELIIEGIGTFVLEAGDRDFMPAGTYHTARVVGEEAVVYLIGEKIR